jgi:integrase
MIASASISVRYGRRHDLGIGSADTITLAEARERARQYRIALLDGKDPLDQRKQQRTAEATEAAARKAEEAKGGKTLADVLDSYLAVHSTKWTNDRHRREWEQSLRRHALPVIGDVRIDKIETAHVMKTLEPIWSSYRVTAERVRGRLEKLLGFAAAKGLREKGDNPARWRGHLSEMLSSGKKKIEHLAAMEYEQCPAAVALLRALGTTEAKALEFLILTAARTNEVLGAQWSEVDFAKGIWVKPEERTKARKAHSVALSDRAAAILKSLPKGSGDEYIFRRADGVSALRSKALLDLMRTRLGLTVTVHGFRAAFSTWAAERTNFPRPVVEAALAHAKGDKVEAAYNRSDLLDKRRKLMSAWESFLASKPVAESGKVVPIGKHA